MRKLQGSDGIRRRLLCGAFVGCNEGLALGHRLWGGVWECLVGKGLRVLSRAAIEVDGNTPSRFNDRLIPGFFFPSQLCAKCVRRV